MVPARLPSGSVEMNCLQAASTSNRFYESCIEIIETQNNSLKGTAMTPELGSFPKEYRDSRYEILASFLLTSA